MTRSSRVGMRRRTVVVLTLGALSVAMIAPVAEAASPKTKRVNLKNNATQVTDESSYDADISPNGRYITFYSESDQLSGKDSNNETDVYLRDMKKKKTRLISVHSNGTQGDAWSGEASVSANGRFIVFETEAKTLFNDKNDSFDVVMRDRKTGKTRLIGKSSKGKQANFGSQNPDMSPNGRYVVFESSSTNLASGTTGVFKHIYIRDRKTGKTQLVSKSSSGKLANAASANPAVSADGRFVAFQSAADNLIGNKDTNGQTDVFVRDRKKKQTRRINKTSAGAQVLGTSSRDAAISGNGKIVAYRTRADLASSDAGGGTDDIYFYNRATRKTRQVSVNNVSKGGDGDSLSPSISLDGRFVTFMSTADNLTIHAPDAWRDIFVHDRKKGRTKLVSRGKNGAAPDGSSATPSVSADGRFVAFDSSAENLVGSDSNGETDIFRRGPLR